MAKKKQIELTIEEKLQNALVPKEEQPYKIPSNWCWIRLLESFVNKTDSKKKIKQKDYLEEGNYPIVDQGRDLIGGYTNDDKLIIYIKKPIIVFGDHTRCIKYINFDFVQGADGTKILEPKKFFLEKYFYYAFKNINIPSLGYRRHYPMFNKLKIQIAPINEQQRIVNRIESLFTKLDRAKELIENTLAQFEQNKMAILHKAFIGELTAKWRKENNIDLSSWQNYQLKDICEKITDGTHQTPKYTDDGGYIFLSSKNVKSGKIDWKNIKYIPKDLHDILYERIAPQRDDILLAKNGTTGVAAIVDRDIVFDIYVSLALLRVNKKYILPMFLLYVIGSPRIKNYFDSNLKGIGVPNLHLKYIREATISVPIIEEQQEIVNILDKLLAKYNKIKNLEQQLEKIELLKKAILAKAFRGELGTNNPDEESAENLLKEILAEK